MRDPAPFRRIYPADGPRKILFDGGMNNKFEKSLIPDDESPDCLNVVFENGSVGTRGGSLKLNTVAVPGGAAFDALYTRTDFTGAESMIAWVGGSAYVLGSTTFVTIPSAQGVMTAGVRVGADQAENYIFFGNGNVPPYKWDGTNFTRHGVYPPTTTHTVASTATGVLTGQYQYKVTWVNSAVVEGNPGPVNATFTAASGTLFLTSIPVAPQSFGVASRKIYRTINSGTTFNLLTTLNDNTTTTYTDTTPDSGLGTSVPPTDNGVPPKYSIIVYHPGLGRFFMNDTTNPNYVWYSTVITTGPSPYTVGNLAFDRFGNKGPDLVRAIKVLENSLIVFGDRGSTIWYFSDNDPTHWVKIPTKSHYGCLSPYAIEYYDNGLIYPATENGNFVGFGHLLGDINNVTSSLLTISDLSAEFLSQKIEPDVFLMQNVRSMSSFQYKNKIYFTVSYGAGQTTNNRIYVLDYSYTRLNKDVPSWTPWTGITASQFVIYGGLLCCGSSTTNGLAYSLNASTYSDNGAAINSYYYTKEFFGLPADINYTKDFRFLKLVVDKAGAYFMGVDILVDTDLGQGDTEEIPLVDSDDLWGTIDWGVGNWGAGVTQADVDIDLGKSTGNRIQFKFTNQNTVNQRFKVHYATFIYNLKGLRG